MEKNRVKITRTRVIETEVEVPETLDGFRTWEFTSGSTTGADFKVFAPLFRKFVRANLPRMSILADFSVGHYDLSGFIQREDRFVYFKISDVRDFPGLWAEQILVRTARDARDFTGGINNYTDLASFRVKVEFLLQRDR